MKNKIKLFERTFYKVFSIAGEGIVEDFNHTIRAWIRIESRKTQFIRIDRVYPEQHIVVVAYGYLSGYINDDDPFMHFDGLFRIHHGRRANNEFPGRPCRL